MPQNKNMVTARVRKTLLISGAAAVAVAVAVAAFLVWPRGAETTVAAKPTPVMTATPAPTPTPTPEPVYDLTGLPVQDVFAITPALPVDDGSGSFTGLVATPLGASAPVFATPGATPVAQLPVTLRFGGTTVPIVERREGWVRVLLAGRQATPATGNPGQLSGWLRVNDVSITTLPASIEVHIAQKTVEIVTSAGRELVANNFGWGSSKTPTPLGRTFIMISEDSHAGYTRGHNTVYLGVQSPTLNDFAGTPVAVTAFHYHDVRSGAVSNGCIRLDAAATDRLAQLPQGTPVTIFS
ncbi:MAG: hypothetical protein JWO10_1398 [Microbacteriaceae bacterium]|nr:hypothetical protein [Microbacteriaceae bacterium]